MKNGEGPGKKRTMGRQGQGNMGIGVPKQNALISQAVDVRRFSPRLISVSVNPDVIGSQSIDGDDQEVKISPGRGGSPAVPGKRKDERGHTDERQEKTQPPRCPVFFHGIPEDYVIGKNGLFKGDAEKKGEPAPGSPFGFLRFYPPGAKNSTSRPAGQSSATGLG